MKKRISKFLVALMLLNSTTSVAFAKNFTDLQPSHWAYKQIQDLASDKTVVGYPDGTFKPDAAATRAEFSTMVIKALRQENSPLQEVFNFSDVSDSHWAYETIQRACAFDLIKGFSDGTFKPEDNISKAEAVAIMISAVNTGDMTTDQAKEALKNYVDINTIPDWALIPAGKAEKYKVTAHNPDSKNRFEPDKKITRAEIAVNLYNMKKEALINPNAKLAEAMTPKKGTGFIIDNVSIDGVIATIPAGTLIPALMATPLNSQKDDKDTAFAAQLNQNLVTKEGFLLIPEGSRISGIITDIKPARYFIRNAKMQLDTKNIYIATNGQKADLPGNIGTKHPCKKGIAAIWRYIIKGLKIKLPEGKDVLVKLDKPVKIDLAYTRIVK